MKRKELHEHNRLTLCTVIYHKISLIGKPKNLAEYNSNLYTAMQADQYPV